MSERAGHASAARDVAPPLSALKTGQVHVWTVSLDRAEPRFRSLYATLSRDERDKAERFALDIDRRRYVLCRGTLRTILARYLDTVPDSLSFAYGAKGKPALAGPLEREAPGFSLAHSAGLALIALARGAEVGVDVERMRDLPDMEDIARRAFSTREMAEFSSLPEGEKKRAFYNGWTRKEAFVKALGDGLSAPLDSFDVSLAPGRPARLLRSADGPGDARRWSIRDVCPAPDYAAAVAVRSRRPGPAAWRLSMRCL